MLLQHGVAFRGVEVVGARRSVQGVAALEAAVREAPEWVVLRYRLLYGPGTWYAQDGLMAERARCGELAADGDVSSLVHVDDAAGAAMEALEWPSGAVNVCDDLPAAGKRVGPRVLPRRGGARSFGFPDGCGAACMGALLQHRRRQAATEDPADPPAARGHPPSLERPPAERPWRATLTWTKI
jgi:nucleoside-diphosphate-sugar epimerase